MRGDDIVVLDQSWAAFPSDLVGSPVAANHIRAPCHNADLIEQMARDISFFRAAIGDDRRRSRSALTQRPSPILTGALGDLASF